MRLVRAVGIVAIAIITLPWAVVGGLFSKKRDCTPEELASELKELAAGKMSGWDQLECVRIKDPRLESIRQEAMAVELPFRQEDRELLAYLATKVALLSPRE